MKIAGIVAEYIPSTTGTPIISSRPGHRTAAAAPPMWWRWIAAFRPAGEPALLPSRNGSAMALAGGADLVLELPLPWSLASAEGFAYGAVSILDALGCVEVISFGSECGDARRAGKGGRGAGGAPLRPAIAFPTGGGDLLPGGPAEGGGGHRPARKRPPSFPAPTTPWASNI